MSLKIKKISFVLVLFLFSFLLMSCKEQGSNFTTELPPNRVEEKTTFQVYAPSSDFKLLTENIDIKKIEKSNNTIKFEVILTEEEIIESLLINDQESLTLLNEEDNTFEIKVEKDTVLGVTKTQKTYTVTPKINTTPFKETLVFENSSSLNPVKGDKVLFKATLPKGTTPSVLVNNVALNPKTEEENGIIKIYNYEVTIERDITIEYNVTDDRGKINFFQHLYDSEYNIITKEDCNWVLYKDIIFEDPNISIDANHEVKIASGTVRFKLQPSTFVLKYNERLDDIEGRVRSEVPNGSVFQVPLEEPGEYYWVGVTEINVGRDVYFVAPDADGYYSFDILPGQSIDIYIRNIWMF